MLDRESVFSWLMMALPLAFLAALVGYPFFYGILLSLQDRPVAHTGTFVGLKNFVTDVHDPIFWRVAINTFVYTGVATLLKMVGGLGLALAMNQHFRMKNLVRALLLLPFIVPTVLSTVAWLWMLDPAFSVVNRLLVALGWPKPGPVLARRSDACDGLDHHHQHLARAAVLRDHPARRPADGAVRTLRGGLDRRRRRMGSGSASSPCRCCGRSS